MDRKTALVAIAAVLFAVAMISGLTGLSAGEANCGSVLGGGGDAAQSDMGSRIVTGTNVSPAQDECGEKKDDRRIIVFGALGLAILTGVIAVAIKEDEPKATL